VRVLGRLSMVTVCLALCLYGVLVIAAHRTPPLNSCGLASRRTGDYLVLGIDLCNDGFFSVTLRSATPRGPIPVEVSAVLTPSREGAIVAASSIIVSPYEQPAVVGSPVEWRIPPERTQNSGKDTYGLRVDWLADTKVPASVMIQYRYLGWPMWPHRANPDGVSCWVPRCARP
jgi:hypothetical protein